MTEDSESIDRLIDQFRAGIDRDKAFQHLFQRFHSPVRRFFERKGFSSDESRDLTQETFIGVFRTLDTFRQESRFESWLFAVMANVYHNELRRRLTYKRNALEISLDVFDSSLEIVEPRANFPERGPLESLIVKERREALRLALQALPDQMRMCCLLRYEKGLKYHEIATVMKISIETVKAHLHQARKRLTATLGEES